MSVPSFFQSTARQGVVEASFLNVCKSPSIVNESERSIVCFGTEIGEDARGTCMISCLLRMIICRFHFVYVHINIVLLSPVLWSNGTNLMKRHVFLFFENEVHMMEHDSQKRGCSTQTESRQPDLRLCLRKRFFGLKSSETKALANRALNMLQNPSIVKFKCPRLKDSLSVLQV